MIRAFTLLILCHTTWAGTTCTHIKDAFTQSDCCTASSLSSTSASCPSGCKYTSMAGRTFKSGDGKLVFTFVTNTVMMRFTKPDGVDSSSAWQLDTKNYKPDFTYTFDSVSFTNGVHRLQGGLTLIAPLNNFSSLTHFRWSVATIESDTLVVSGGMDSLGPVS